MSTSWRGVWCRPHDNEACRPSLSCRSQWQTGHQWYADLSGMQTFSGGWTSMACRPQWGSGMQLINGMKLHGDVAGFTCGDSHY
eukprot:scaffold170522_cov22-Tisochrysis_lutea.AAC.1